MLCSKWRVPDLTEAAATGAVEPAGEAAELWVMSMVAGSGEIHDEMAADKLDAMLLTPIGVWLPVGIC